MDYRQWHVGMKVVCVSVAHLKGDVAKLAVNAIYVIRGIQAVTDGFSDRGRFIVRLQGVSLPKAKNGHERGFYAWRFRPVETRKTSIEIFQAMLTPKRETERA